MPKAFYILFGAVFTLTVSYSLGRLLLERLKIRLYREEEKLFALICGASLLHLVVFTLCSAQVARKGVILAVGFAILAYGVLRGVFRRSKAPALPPLERNWKWLFSVVFVAYGLLYLRNAMGPEMSPDGSGYHLGLVARYLREHGFSRITTTMYASLTQGVEMLYLFAFTFGRHSAASLVHFGFTLTLPLLMISYARRYEFPTVGIGGALLFLCAPVVGVDGTSAYNDIAVTTVVFALFYLLHIWGVERRQALLIPIGLLAGFCFATKYTAALAIPFAGAYILWKTRSLRPALVFGACAALMMLPWMAKNWIIVGNPLSPFLNSVFPNPNVRISFEAEYLEHMRHYGGINNYSEIPLELTVSGAKLSGLLGPVFALTPLALLAVRWPEGRRLLVAALFFASPYFNNIGTRFLLPSLPFFSLALAMVLVRARFILPLVLVAHAILSWPAILRTYCSEYAWKLQHVPIDVALRIGSEENFLTRNSYGYVVARMIEDHVPPGEKVFSYSGASDSYTSREILTAYMSGFNSNLGDMVSTGIFKDSSPVRKLRFSFQGQPVRRLKLVQTKTGSDHWSITECRIFSAAHEIPRSPEWRLRASPNPWDVQMAFDNSPVTRWRSWQAIFPGMSLEVDLGYQQNVDAVLLEITKDQYQTQVMLYGQREAGPWFVLSGAPEVTEAPFLAGLRRAAMEEMRARGVRYLLAAPDDPAAEDYRLNDVLWGIRMLAERGGTRLYAIQPELPQ